MKHTPKLFSRIASAVMLCGMLLTSALPVSATQSRTSYFSGGYSLTGNGAADMVAVASAQVGKTKSNLGYSEAWCADFVGDCAKLCSQSDAVPLYGGCSGLYDRVIQAGGKVVSDRQAGDLVFYKCKYCGFVHVGIVADGTYSYEGNYSGKVTKVGGSYTDSNGHKVSTGAVTRIYVRPNYKGTKTSSASSGSSSALYTATVTAKSGLNVRSGPSTGYGKITAIPYGRSVTVYEERNGWARIDAGWVSAEYLSKASSNSGSSVRYYATVTARSGLNVRSGPSTGYGKLTAIPYGVSVPVYETSGGWAKVSYGGRTGWVSAEYLR